MPNTPLDPPDTPPQDPRDLSDGIPEGLATKLGKIVTAVLAVLAVASELGLSIDNDTQDMLNRALVVVGLLMGGRYAQSYAALRDAPGASTLSPIEFIPTDDDIRDFGGERG
jgi:hypothetical protein